MTDAIPNPVHIKQVKSLLRDRQQCATVAGIAQELQVSRTVAAQILETIAAEAEIVSSSSNNNNNNNPPSWHVTLCQSQEITEQHGEESIAGTGEYPL